MTDGPRVARRHPSHRLVMRLAPRQRLAAAPTISFALAPVGAGLTNAAFLARESVDPPRLVLTLDALPATLPIWSDGFESGDRWFWN